MAKSFNISKQIVWDSYLKIKANGGSSGVDRQTMNEFDKNLSKNLYKIWNRLSSAVIYHPQFAELISLKTAVKPDH